MKTLAVASALATLSGLAFAQGAADPVAELRACSGLERQAQVDCLDNVLRNVTSPAPPPPARPDSVPGNWIVSETTSPVDYAPIITASTFSSQAGASGQPMQLSVRCRAGRTELIVGGPNSPGSGKDYAITYRIDDKPPVPLAGARPSSGTGVAFPGDTVRILQTLPDQGELVIQIVQRGGAAQEGRFLLGGLKPARDRLAKVCKWPQTVRRAAQLKPPSNTPR